MAKSPEEMADAMIANMKEKTGKTLEQWIAVAKKSGEEKHGQVVKFLKTEHGMTHGFANLIAHKHLKSDAGSAKGAAGANLRRSHKGGKRPRKRCRDRTEKNLCELKAHQTIRPDPAFD